MKSFETSSDNSEPRKEDGELKSAIDLAMEKASAAAEEEKPKAETSEPADEDDRLYTAAELAMKRATEAESEEASLEPADESDKLYTAAELAMQEDHEPFRGTIKYPYKKELTEEEDRKRFDDEKAESSGGIRIYEESTKGIVINKELIDKVLAAKNKPEKAGESAPEEQVERINNPMNKRIVDGSDSFENLALRLRANQVSISGSLKEYSPDELAEIVFKVQRRELPLLMVTASDGFRAKLTELVHKDEDAKKLAETSVDIRQMLEKDPSADVAAENVPAKNQKQKRNWFGWLRRK